MIKVVYHKVFSFYLSFFPACTCTYVYDVYGVIGILFFYTYILPVASPDVTRVLVIQTTVNRNCVAELLWGYIIRLKRASPLLSHTRETPQLAPETKTEDERKKF